MSETAKRAESLRGHDDGLSLEPGSLDDFLLHERDVLPHGRVQRLGLGEQIVSTSDHISGCQGFRVVFCHPPSIDIACPETSTLIPKPSILTLNPT